MLILEVRVLRDKDIIATNQTVIRQGEVGIRCTLEPGQQIIHDDAEGMLVLTEYEVTYKAKLYLADVG